MAVCIFWYVYECPPQDWWDGWQRVDCYQPDEYGDAERFATLLATAKDAIRSESSWEGDGVWRFAGLPNGESDGELIFSVKQSNNGTTFFASPYALPWWKEHLCSRRRRDGH